MADYRQWLNDVREAVQATQTERQRFANDHQKALAELEPFGTEVEEALWRFRMLSLRAIEKGVFAYRDLDSFLQFSIVNAHDAAADALACIYSGSGAPSAALLRRLYELTNILTAGWQRPDDLLSAMRDALAKPYTDDRYAALAEGGELGAVMPAPQKIRHLAFDGEPEYVEEFESTLASFAHGGFAANFFYVTDHEQADRLDHMIQSSRDLACLAKDCTVMASAAASQIAARLGFDMSPLDAYGIFHREVVEAREDQAMRDFDRAFPQAVDVLWGVCIGIGGVTSEMAEYIGSREYDSLRRQLLVLVDALESAWLATELLFRGRLIAAATVVRRLFELSLEAQAWAQMPKMMAHRFDQPRGRMTTPAASRLIRYLHGPIDSKLQRRTYSTLCSVAHGGAQAADYLLDGEWPRFRIQPAPAFMARHHLWLLGTLISGVDALLGASLVIGGRLDQRISRNYGGYLEVFHLGVKDIPGLNLVRHEDANPEPGAVPE